VEFTFGKFLNVQVLQLETIYTRGSFAFWFNNTIVIGADQSGGIFLGRNASILIYSPEGTLIKKYPLPYPCTSLPCNTGTNSIATTGNILTVIISEPYIFAQIDLTNGKIVKTGTPPPWGTGYSTWQINDTTVFINYEYYNETVKKTKTSWAFLDLNTLITTPYIPAPFYRAWLPTSFVVNATTGESFICAVNEESLAFVYKGVTFRNNSYVVTNSSVGIHCDGQLTYSPTRQQALVTSTSLYGLISLYFLNVINGKLHQSSNNVTSIPINPVSGYGGSPLGLSGFVDDGPTVIMPFRFLENQTYGYYQQISVSQGNAVVKDLVQMPQPFYLGGGGGAVNYKLKTFISGWLGANQFDGYGCGGPSIFIINFDDN